MKLNLDRDQLVRCRELAEQILRPIGRYIDMHSTAAVERAVLRLLGFNGAVEIEPGRWHPAANLIVEGADRRLLKNGAAALAATLKKKYPNGTHDELAQKILSDPAALAGSEEMTAERAQAVIKPWIDSAFRHVDRMRYKKEEMRAMGPASGPLKCISVATGDIEDDARQAKAAARLGADVIAHARSTAQSLLDYVPHGATGEGYGGTFATQENWHFLREAVDDVSKELGRYVRISASSNGLCMPELAVIGALEGTDYLNNDAFYGVIFRDINVKRSLVDQHFARIMAGRAGMVVNTSEDELVAAGDDAYARHPVALASQFLNEDLARRAGMRDECIGLTLACELDPFMDDGFVHEVAMGQLMREVFPRVPMRLAPSRRHAGGDGFFAQAQGAVCGLAGTLTGQVVQEFGPAGWDGPLPGLRERFEALKTARHVLGGARSLGDEVTFATNGRVMRRARSILELTQKFLIKVRETGFFESFEHGFFADVNRPRDAGRGGEAVFEKSRRYYNPFLPQSGERR